MSKLFIVANWKMNPQTELEAAALARDAAVGVEAVQNVDVVLCPPFPFLVKVRESAPFLFLGAQDCFWEAQGAYTGEVSADILKRIECTHVILGHSERRRNVGETLDMVNKKVRAVLSHGLVPIVCVGEEKDDAKDEQELKSQLEHILAGVSADDMKHTVLVYEPVWAISTQGNYHPASPELVFERIALFRAALSTMFGEEIGKSTAILYGGSVNAENVRSFIAEGMVQGALVGQASLNAAVFASIVRNALS